MTQASESPLLARTYYSGCDDARARVLIVDDELAQLLSMKRQLRRLYSLYTAMDANEALRKIGANGPFAAVVCDHRMPGASGVEFLSMLRTILPATTRIMLTGDGSGETAADAINQAGVHYFLQKPCPAAVIENTIEMALDDYDQRLRQPVTEQDASPQAPSGGPASVMQVIDSLSLFASGSPVSEEVQHSLACLSRRADVPVSLAYAVELFMEIQAGRMLVAPAPITLSRLMSDLKQIFETLSGEHSLQISAVESVIIADRSLLLLALTMLCVLGLERQPHTNDPLCIDIGPVGDGQSSMSVRMYGAGKRDLPDRQGWRSIRNDTAIRIATIIAQQHNGHVFMSQDEQSREVVCFLLPEGRSGAAWLA